MKKFTLSIQAKDKIFIWGMLALPILNFLVFYLYVNFDSLLMAFQVPVGNEIEWGFDNFRTMFKEFSLSGSVLSVALKNTLIYFFASLLLTLPLSFFLCYFLYKKVRGYKIFRVIFYLPNIISASVLVILFKYLIEVNGPISALIQSLGGKRLDPLLKMSQHATSVILFYTVFFGISGNMILFSGAMSNVDSSVVEAAKIDGANMWEEIIHIVIPLIWPTLSTVLIFQFIGVFNASGPILLFTRGTYDTMTVSYFIYDKVTFGSSLHYPSAVGLFFTVVGAPIAIFMRWFINKFYNYEA